MIRFFASLLLAVTSLSAYLPSNYNNSSTLPSRVYYCGSLGSLAGYTYDVTESYDIDIDENYQFEGGKVYVPYYADISYSSDGMTLDYVSLRVFENPSISALASCAPYFFSVSGLGADCGIIEYGYSLFLSSQETCWITTIISHSSSYGFNYGLPYFSTYYSLATNTAFEHITLDNNVFLENFAQYTFYFASSLQNSYLTALNNAYSNGEDVGRELGYTQGYNDAVSEGGRAGVVTDLFGGILSVPIDILNGLMPFVIWDTPIIGIILTFVVIGIIIFVIKRFI